MIYNFNRDIPVAADVEVLVVGGGPGGVCAATMAARQGAKTCLAERYGRPAIVLSGEGDSFTGSGRSVEGFDLMDALNSCGELFEKYGGHSLAAGLTVSADNLEVFRSRINQYAAQGDMPIASLNIDCKLNPAVVNLSLAEELSKLEPFGAGNPAPLFGLWGMEIKRIDFVGDGRHTRLTVGKNGVNLSAMLFSVGKEDMDYAVGEAVELAVNLSVAEPR